MGQGVLRTTYEDGNGTKEIAMSRVKRYAKKQAKARQRRHQKAHERLERDRRQAQRAAEALHQALEELRLPDTVVTEIEGRLRSQQKLLGKIVGVMFPALFGCRALTPARSAAQTFLAQAASTLGAGGVGAHLAPCARQKPGHSEPLAVDLGLG
jgi:capsule polysaccharide export protein KpsE/RkpR